MGGPTGGAARDAAALESAGSAGEWQLDGQLQHLTAHRFTGLSPMLAAAGRLRERSGFPMPVQAA